MKAKHPKNLTSGAETCETAKHKRSIGLYALLVLNVVLFISMLMLCGVYLNMRINGVRSGLPEIPENDKWVLSGSGYNVQSGSRSLLAPSFIGVKSGNTMLAAAFDTAARASFIGALETNLDAVLAGSCETIPFAGEDEKNAYTAALLQEERFFYTSFFGELPAAALLPAVRSGNFPSLSENFFVKYLFFLPDENENLYAVCLDADLNAVRLYPQQAVPYTLDELAAYNGMSGYVSFTFAQTKRPAALFDRSFDVDAVVILPSDAFYSFDLADDNTKQLLAALDFNTNMVKSFRSGDNSTVSFVGEGHELYVSLTEDTVTYSAYEGGIHMSEYLGYYPSDGKRYSFDDEVLCVKYLLGSLDRTLIGGDACASLVSVTKNDSGNTVFGLKYVYNGVMLTENPLDITVEISGSYITELHIHTLFCDGGSLKKPVLPQTLAMSLLKDEQAVQRYDEFYAIFENDADTNQHKLVWAAGKAGND